VDKNTSGGVSKDVCLRVAACTRDNELKGNETVPLILGDCSQCGSEKFNFSLMKSNHEYYIIFDDKNCITKNNESQVILASCYGSMNDIATFSVEFPELKKVTGDSARLINAAAGNDSVSVQNLVKFQGVDVNSRYWDASTALMAAAKAGHVGIVKELIELSADVNLADRDGLTAAIDSALAGHANVVKLLLEEGASIDVDAKTASGLTALWAAAR